MKKDIEEAFRKAQLEFERASRVRLREAMDEVLPYIMRNMHDSFPPRARTSIKTNRIYAEKNKTNKLYSRSGNLKRSMIWGGYGNISKIETDGSIVEATIGIDLEKIPYAAVHEFGSSRMPKRPYFYPGVKAYLKDNETYIVSEIIKEAFVDW